MASKDFEQNGKARNKKVVDAPRGGGDAEFRGYVNLNLSPEEKEAFLVWVSAEGVLEMIAVVVRSGVNVAVKPDPKAIGYLASATQRDRASVNAGLCVTARGSTPDLALSRLMYNLAILSRAESWEATQPMADPDRW